MDRAMMYVIYHNADKTELGLTEKRQWDTGNPAHHQDYDGAPTILAMEFEAEDWDAAKLIYEKWMEEIHAS
jgi:hypothetical protein